MVPSEIHYNLPLASPGRVNLITKFEVTQIIYVGRQLSVIWGQKHQWSISGKIVHWVRISCSRRVHTTCLKLNHCCLTYFKITFSMDKKMEYNPTKQTNRTLHKYLSWKLVGFLIETHSHTLPRNQSVPHIEPNIRIKGRLWGVKRESKTR